MNSWIDDCIVGIQERYVEANIYEIYDALYIAINKLPKNHTLLQGKDAIYHRIYLGFELVYIRDVLDFEYEKYILAHELGHAILHTGICEAAFNRNLINKGKLERQAHYFAIKFLDKKVDPIEAEGMTAKQIADSLHIAEDSLEYVTEK